MQAAARCFGEHGPARWAGTRWLRALPCLREGVCHGAGRAEASAYNCSLKERPELTLEKRNCWCCCQIVPLRSE